MIYKLWELESTFNAIFNLKNVIIRYTYKNPNMNYDGFSENYKTLVRLGNINFINYDQKTSANEFFHSSHLLLSNILQTVRVRHNSKTLTDKIFSNETSSKKIKKIFHYYIQQSLVVSQISLTTLS